MQSNKKTQDFAIFDSNEEKKHCLNTNSMFIAFEINTDI